MASEEGGDTFSAVSVARATLAAATTGALATLGADGAPFASLALIATDAPGDIVLLLSQLAVHTGNLAADPRASLLVVAPGGENGNALAGARLTLSGGVDRAVDADGQARFLARHPEARRYASFGDFGFWRLRIASAHLVAGFGRIADIAGSELSGVTP